MYWSFSFKDFLKKSVKYIEIVSVCHSKYMEKGNITGEVADLPRTERPVNWPAQSPHLNIIENLRVILKEKVSCHSPRNVDKLWNVCELEWHRKY